MSGLDLSGLELSGMDLHGAIFYDWDTFVSADLSCATLRGANLKGAHLTTANLRNAGLVRAILREARLDSANLRQAMLMDADLRTAVLFGADLRKADLRGCDLQNALLHGARLQEACLAYANLQHADLARANLRHAVLSGASLQGADLRDADCSQLNLLRVAEGGLHCVRFCGAMLDRTLMKREQLGVAIGDEKARAYREAEHAYLALKQNFESLGDYAAAAWAYVQECRMEAMCHHPRHARRFYGVEELGDGDKHRLPYKDPRVWWFNVRHTAQYMGHVFVDWLCGYGESWLKTLRAMTVTLLLFAFVFLLTGGVLHQVPGADGLSTWEPTRRIGDVLLFTLGAFTTMQPESVRSAAQWVEYVAGFEALVGIALTGLLGFVLGNRIRRS